MKLQFDFDSCANYTGYVDPIITFNFVDDANTPSNNFGVYLEGNNQLTLDSYA